MTCRRYCCIRNVIYSCSRTQLITVCSASWKQFSIPWGSVTTCLLQLYFTVDFGDFDFVVIGESVLIKKKYECLNVLPRCPLIFYFEVFWLLLTWPNVSFVILEFCVRISYLEVADCVKSEWQSGLISISVYFSAECFSLCPALFPSSEEFFENLYYDITYYQC